MKCLNCNIETLNNKFCSRSCAASYNNKISPKRKTKKTCVICGEPVKSYKYNRCEIHWNEYKINKFKLKTIGEYRLKLKNKHPSWIHSHIRQFARSWLKHLTKLPCSICGYDKHVELCHIKPLSEFNDSDLLSLVNSEDNIIQLCRNCHWELDNGLINL